jgi:hypothetical protein
MFLYINCGDHPFFKENADLEPLLAGRQPAEWTIDELRAAPIVVPVVVPVVDFPDDDVLDLRLARGDLLGEWGLDDEEAQAEPGDFCVGDAGDMS